MDDQLYILEVSDGTRKPMTAFIGSRDECEKRAEQWTMMYERVERKSVAHAVKDGAIWSTEGAPYIHAMIHPISFYGADFFDEALKQESHYQTYTLFDSD